jgi:hypothetical protein
VGEGGGRQAKGLSDSCSYCSNVIFVFQKHGSNEYRSGVIRHVGQW